MSDRAKSNAVAIVGMGCRFPGGADAPERFWALLRDGIDAITEVPPERFDLAAHYDPDPAAPGKIYARHGGFVERIDEFDAAFFGIAPREARRIDPQQRLLLEVAWEALEDAGQPPHALAGSNTAVVVGIASHDYIDAQGLAANRERIDAFVNAGSAASIAANRVSYVLDLHGPSFAVDTACSSSLTAVHLALRSLRSGEVDLAIVGGVGALLVPEVTIGFCKASMLSPDGRCHAFDARANGYVRSEGAGAVVLKPLARALEDGDPIRAVLLGSAANQDGRTKGISVPSASAQEAMIRQALRDADVDPMDVGYVEAHGTGTAVGDPIEAAAIGSVLGAGRAPDEPCVIGSVKTNLGHLEAASGIAGLIKAALMVEHREIPASLHFARPNPAIDFDALRLRVPTSLESWPERAARTVVGVNSFGFGGANAHVVLDAPPERAAGATGRRRSHRGDQLQPRLLPLSARAPDALRALASRHAQRLSETSPAALHDHCYTAAVRRSHHAERLALVADTPDDLGRGLEAYLADASHPGLVVGNAATGADAKLAFVFTGMGPQAARMGTRLYEHEPAYRDVLDEVERLLWPLAGWSLLDELAADEAASRVHEARIAHVANFALQVATAALWRSWGITPDAVVGHSSGEMAAACVAGALSLEDGVRLAYHRGRLQQRLTGAGRMLAAALTPAEAEHAIAGAEDRVSLAAINAPTSVTLSGAADVLERIAGRLEAEGRFARFLPVEVPYHAPQMEPLRDEFLAAIADIAPREPDVPFALEVTGSWWDGEPLDAAYWWRNVREPVRFVDAVDRLLEAGCRHVVEVGPHPVLAPAIAECGAARGAALTLLPSLRRGDDDRRVMLASLAALYAGGTDVDWAGVYPTGTVVPLPTYPWQRESHWFDSGESTASPRPRSAGVDSGHPLLGRRLSSPRPTWETTFDDPRTTFLDHHVVQGATVFPGAAYVELMLAAAAAELGDVPVTLQDVAFEKLLFLRRPRVDPVQLHLDTGAGSIGIYGATNGDDGDLWTLHATGRLGPQPADAVDRIDLASARARCTTPRTAEAHYATFERRAYSFGSAFHTLHSIWFGEDEVVAQVEFPPDVDLAVEAYRVHPALLDAALQLFGAARIDSDASPRDDVPFFPVSIRHLEHRSNPGRRFWVYARVRHAGDPERWNGDAWLTDEAGQVSIAMHEVRLKALADAADARHDASAAGLYELTWEEAPLDPIQASGPYPLRSTSDVREVVETRQEAPEHTPEVVRYTDAGEPSLNRVAAGFAALALEATGWRAGDDSPARADDLGIAPRHRRLFEHLTRMVEHAAPARSEPAALQRELDALHERDPAIAAEIELVRRGGERLAEVLRGELDAREVLLSGDAIELLSRVYHDSPTSRGHHALLADAVTVALGEDRAERRLRVLEIGAGTGAATAALLPVLPTSTEYVFTDISPYFVSQARERFGERPGMRFVVLDIERDPAEQGIDLAAFDLVVGVNVLHTTESLSESLGHAHRLLAPGGMLALQELTRRSPWYNLVFGLLDGWWRFADADVRPDHPLLSPRAWRDQLDRSGFVEATTLFQGADEDDHLQTVILARSPHADPDAPSATSRHWLVLADAGGVGERLATVLRSRGDRTTLAHPGHAYRWRSADVAEVPLGDTEAARRLLVDAREGAHVDGIVHLWSLRDGTGDASQGELDTAALMDAQRDGCGSALALLRALAHDEEQPPDVWLVTNGAQAVAGSDAAPNVAHASLWGLGRVALSEQAGGRCRLVDLGPTPTPDEVAALAAELHGDGADDEVALRGAARLVRRLESVTLSDRPAQRIAKRMDPETGAFRLEIDRPGAIDSVRLHEVPQPEPGPGELVVRVVASGLNFRDVLRSLGVLPAAAFRHDPDPDAMGIECAGIVVACGEDTEGFAVGDEVIALAGSAHGSRAIAVAALSVAKPPNISFEQGASILNAFVTVEYALHDVARIEPGERLLVHSATGAVGLVAIQHAQRLGVEVFATAGSPEKRDHLRSLGVAAAMDSRSLAWADEVLERTDGEGVDVVLNALSGEALAKGLSVLRRHGRFVELGKRDILEDARLGMLPFERNLSFHSVDLMQLAHDRPQLAQRLVRQVVRDVADGTLSAVPVTAFDLGEAAQAFRLMAQAKHIGKVALTLRGADYPVHARHDAPLCHADATYLITGGLGGLGLAVANWLVDEHGARNVVLMSRSGTPADGAAALERLQASPANVVVEAGDVSDERDVRRVVTRIERDLPPLRGVVHAAMVLDDAALVDLDAERFRRVLEPKVAGAWNLHRLTSDLPLDVFVLFSSIASVVGHPMQANYAAANAFLDTLAAYRRGLGLPALTIGWGAVAGAGYVSRHPDIGKHLERAGLEPSTVDETLARLGELLKHDLTHVIAARVEWQKWAQLNSFAGASRRFQRFLGSDDVTTEDTSDTDSPLARLREAPAEERRDVAVAYLRVAVAGVLGGTQDNVPTERPLAELGIDSLMAVELVTRLDTDLGVRLPVVKVLEGTTVVALARLLMEALELDERAPVEVDDASTPASQPPAEATTYPLSFEQRRFAYLEQIEPGNPALHLYAAARLSGTLDVRALRRSLDELVRRHGVLRTRVEMLHAEPSQAPLAPMPAPLDEHDLSHLPAEERDAALQRVATAAIRRPFDLTQPPHLRGLLVKLAEREHAFVLMVHHIAAEAWTVTHLVREIMALYAGFLDGPSSTLPLPTVTYDAYVRHQLETIDGPLVRSQLDFWRAQLDGASPGLPLETDRPRATGAGHRGKRRRFELSRERSDALRELGRSEGATLFMTLLAAFQALIHRSSGATDLSIGTPVFSRDRAGLEDVVGCCMNTVVLRTDLGGDPSFRTLLRRARQTSLDAFAHQDVPFDEVVAALGPERDVAAAPLFRTMLIVHSLRQPTLRMAGLEVEPLGVDAEAAVTDLTLLVEAGEALHGAFEYDTELFDDTSIDRLCDRFLALTDAVVERPESPLSDLPLVGAEERRQVTVVWNDTDTGAPDRPSAYVHDLVDEQAERTPDAIAVETEGERVTYRDLRTAADHLAARLADAGVAAGVAVGVALHPSPSAVIAALAVLKAGGVYVPLDPSHPRARLLEIVADAGIAVVVTQASAFGDASWIDARVVDLDAERQALAGRAPERVQARVGGDDPAYLLYTSGSTGAPKGVVVPHRALVNQVRWRQETFDLAAADRVLLHTPLTFDPSVWELLGPLAAGARLIVPPHANERDPARLAEAMARHRVTLLQAVPTLVSAVLDEDAIDACTDLRLVLCGGEPLSAELRDRCHARLSADLHNLYGPTETTIDATHWACRRDDGRPVIPIGRPIANVRTYVVDDRLRPVPVGVPGELCIAGAGVALGYHGRADETAARFTPDPFDGRPGARMFRSGDRARWRADGTLEWLGRSDDQVKVRGHRIELGEVEAVLARHPDVRVAAAVVTDDGERLVAFATAASERQPDASALTRFMAERLPRPLVPSAFVTLPELPRTPGGKLDRRALTKHALDGVVRSARHAVAPRDDVERRLVGLWQELLPGSHVGVRDDFFELGGHSLLALRLAARVRAEFGTDLPVAALIEDRTIEALGRRLRGKASSTAPLVAIRSSGAGRPVFCVHPLGASVMQYVDLAHELGDDRPFYALEARGVDDDTEPHDSIEAMAAAYLDTVRSVQPEGPYLLAGWSMGGVIAYEMARTLETRPGSVALVALLDPAPAFAVPDPRDAAEPGDRSLVSTFARSLGLGFEQLAVTLEALDRMPLADQLTLLSDLARDARLLPDTVDATQLRRRLRVFEAHLRALQRYEARPYTGPVTIIDAAARHGAAADANGVPDWRRLAVGDVERVTVPGDHHTMLHAPHVRQLARILARTMERAETLVA